MEKKKKQDSAIVFLLKNAGSKKKKYIFSVVFAFIGVIFSLFPYFVIADIITKLLDGEKSFDYYLIACLIIFIAWTLRVIFHALSTSLSHQATFAVIGNLRKMCTDKLAKMPLGDILEMPSGALKSTIVERIDSIETTLAHILPEFTTNLVGPIGIIIYLFYIDYRMAFASLLTLPIGMICYMGMMIGYKPRFKRAIKATKNLNDTSVEYINGIEVIKVFGKAKSQYQKFVVAAKEGAQAYIDWMRQCNIFFTFAMNITPATMIAVLPIGTLLMLNGTLTTNSFILCIILSVSLIQPLITVLSYTDDLGQIGVITGEIRNLLDHREMNRKDDKIEIKNHTIKLSNVHFSYDDKEVLHGMDMEIKDGSFVALVGPSGSGKTTIARIIASLWDVDSGEVKIDDINIKEIPLDYYNEQISFVSQNNYLFNQSVMENIRIGKIGKKATDLEVIEVAKKCGCHDFIMQLENGYDTVVGSRGGSLSGGERQRISIARAMLKDAPIIILDEATAYTDPENEALIQESVQKLVKDKTLIVIAHRLSTIKDADEIFVIENGLIEEKGKHEELIKNNKLYKRMWDAHIKMKDGIKEIDKGKVKSC